MITKKIFHYALLFTLIGSSQLAWAADTDTINTVIADGRYNSIAITGTDNSTRYSQKIYAIYGNSDHINVTLTGDQTITITDTGYYIADNSYTADVRAISNATVDAGGAGPIKLNITANPKSSTSVDSSGGTIQAIYAYDGASTVVRGGVDLNIDAQGGTISSAYRNATNINAHGIVSETGWSGLGTPTTVDIQGDVKMNIKAKAGSSNTTGNSSNAEAYVYSYGIMANTTSGAGAKNTISGNVDITIDAQGGTSISKGGYANSYSIVHGLRAVSGQNVLGGNLKLDLTAQGGSATSNGTTVDASAEAMGLYASGRGSSIAGDADIQVEAISGTLAGNYTGTAKNTALAYGLYAFSNNAADDRANIIKGNVAIKATATAGDNTSEFRAYSLFASTRGVNDLSSSGKTKQLEGDVMAQKDARNTINLDTEGSYLQGNVLTSTNATNATNDITLASGGTWRPVYDNRYGTYYDKDNVDTYLKGYTVTTNSIAAINLKTGGVIDLNWDGARTTYRELNINKLEGTGGVFKISTDLNSETNGDKINITSADNSAKHYISVADISLTNGTKVMADKKLLVATDASGQASFAGKSLDTGGLWETTPTIEKEGNNDWYLTMIKAAPNPSSNTLLKGYEAGYSLWRTLLVDDSLRSRVGEVYNSTAQAGMWARIKTGKLAGSGFDSSYQTYQIGADKKINNNIYGVALDYSRGTIGYDIGNGENSMVALNMYATNYRKDGLHTDLVLRVGKLSGELKSYGEYPDSSDATTWGYSISYEIGKKFSLDKAQELERGWSIEPQAQLIIGHMNGGSYTSARGVEVERGGVNAILGRVGFSLNYKQSKGEGYIKANILREFGANDKIHLRAANGEVMDYQGSYKDTWYELGIGGNVQLSKRSYLYGDIARSFGATIQKKWQLNAGVRVDF